MHDFFLFVCVKTGDIPCITFEKSGGDLSGSFVTFLLPSVFGKNFIVEFLLLTCVESTKLLSFLPFTCPDDESRLFIASALISRKCEILFW